MNEPTGNMQDFVLHSLRAAAIALKHLSAQRDEARAVARRYYQRTGALAELYIALRDIRDELLAENARLRARLQELEGEDMPPQNTANVIERAAKFLSGEAKRMRNFYRQEQEPGP